MIITRVETLAYRNLAHLPVVPGARFNVLSGDNAQGKTNFLEAVCLLCGQRSFRASRTAELIRFGQDEARVSGEAVVGGLERALAVFLRVDGGRRMVVDGKGTRAGSARLEGLSAVLFTPEDLQVPRGGPAERRRLLDRAIETVWPAYVSLQRDYGKTLQSRNRVLRDQPPDLARLLDVYDEQLAELGSKLVATRRRYLRTLGPSFADVFERISQTGVQGELSYQAAPEVLEAGHELGDIGPALKLLMHRRRAEDLARKTTTAGPHTDDVTFLLDGQPARHYGSQGQIRSMVLGFRITQIMDIHRRLGHHPILLLDDVSSELDPTRNNYLFDFIQKIDCQVFLTTTRPELVPLTENIVYFKVDSGQISPIIGPLPAAPGVLT